MNAGKVVGYIVLSIIDALLPPVFVIGTVFLVAPVELWEWLFPYAVALGVITFVSAFVVGLLRVRHGGKPFPVTKGFYRLFAAASRVIWP